jgi:hypothetical protein
MLRDLGFGKPEEHWLSKIAVLTCFDAEFGSGRRLSFLASVPTGGDHVDEIHKTQEKWNGAGTFGFLMTLRKHERCEKRRSKDCAD